MLFSKIMVALALLLCFISTISDTKTSIIPNRVLLTFSVIAIFLDTLFYGIFFREGIALFLSNAWIVSLCAIGLYLLDLWAAGDAKLFVSLSLMFPTPLFYNQEIASFSPMTVMIVISFSCAFIYVIGESLLYALKERRLSIRFSQNALGFLKNYVICCVYLSVLNSLLSLVPERILQHNRFLFLMVAMFLIVIVFRYPLLEKCLVLCLFGLIAILLFLFTKGYKRITQFQFASYLYLLVVSVLRNISEQYNYQTISTADLKPGMILSSFSVLRMSSSRIKGLPESTTEDLRSRLTLDEVYSIKRWGESAKGSKTLTIVKKIPFALFISISYVAQLSLYLGKLVI